jgi:predicted ATPase/transcriptional regulator with XRE-family HTH domain
MPDISMHRFGHLLRRHRLAAGLSQEELAERAGLSVDAVSVIERGRRANPRPYTLRVLADALSLTDDDRQRLIAAAQAVPPSSAEPHIGGTRAVEGEWGRLEPPPRPPTGLIGREREVAAITFALRSGQARLLTLTGPGGVGKTRLAIAAAEASAEAIPDGVAWVELAHIIGPAEAASALVAGAIARVLGAKEPAAHALAVSLAAAIGSRKLLLLLDNFEHLLGAAPLIAEVLATCPELVMLVTSRERLRLRGEREFAVHPLAVPDLQGAAGEDATGTSGVAAVRLFVERALEVQGGFALTEANTPAVASVCRQLDGLPLAIELAAPWVKVLPPKALAERLTSRLPLLVGGGGDLPDRQQTMRDTIAWSYELLRPSEQRLFRRLGVFAGGFTLEAAEWVAGDGFQGLGKEPATWPLTPDTRHPTLDTLALVTALVDKSLVRPMAAAAAGAVARFGMLETIREFALEQLAASGEVEATRAAHAAHIADLVRTLIPNPGGGAQEATWLERLAAEVPNLRSALTVVVERGKAEAAFQMAEAWQLLAWSSRADSGEALRWLEAALTLGGGAEAQVHALIAAASLMGLRGDLARATALADEGLAVAHANAYPFGVAYACFYGGIVAKFRGDLDAAAASLNEAIVRWRKLGEPYWMALARNNLADVVLARGDIAGAGVLAAEGLAGSRAVGDAYGTALGCGSLAAVACDQGDLPRAVELYAESLALWSAAGDQRGVAGALAGLAGVSVADGDYLQAARLLGVAAALGEAVEASRLVHHERYERALAATRAILDAATFDEAWAEGRAHSSEGIATLIAEIAPARD